MPRSLECCTTVRCEASWFRERASLQKFRPLFSTVAWIAKFFQFISLFVIASAGVSVSVGVNMWYLHSIPFQLFRMTLRKVPILIILTDFICFRSLDSRICHPYSQSGFNWRDTFKWKEQKMVVRIKWSLFEVILWSRKLANESFVNSQKLRRGCACVRTCAVTENKKDH